MEIVAVYALGAGLYGLIELLWRGWTHWTMLLCGGLCFTLIYLIGGAALPTWAKCLLCAVSISAVEFVCGCLVNIILGMQIWDYSDEPLNLLGQVCPLYSFFWLLLSIPALTLCRHIRQLLT